MKTERNSQYLLLLTLFSVLFSQTLALFVEAEALRNVRHADGVSTRDIGSLLDHYSPKKYTESLIEKRSSNDISEDLGLVKRQSDTEFGAAFERFLKIKAERREKK
ncbi:VIP peptides-like [Myotis daubentonii]|uniref:VIP peptides-like n=1 Tax=Myotis daubentonii TaxID=98922 RepID=UPI002873B6B3|nr:VIP peptides-like [Myotis daubentonii]